MSELAQSLVNRFYRFLGNNIHSRRYDMRLPLTVSLLDPLAHAGGVYGSSALQGYLCDISKTGLSIVVPSFRFGNCYLVGSNYVLHITAEILGGAISIKAIPVRFDRLNNPGGGQYLIGARITQMTDSDRKRLIEYVQQVRSGKATSFSLAHDAKSV